MRMPSMNPDQSEWDQLSLNGITQRVLSLKERSSTEQGESAKCQAAGAAGFEAKQSFFFLESFFASFASSSYPCGIVVNPLTYQL